MMCAAFSLQMNEKQTKERNSPCSFKNKQNSNEMNWKIDSKFKKLNLNCIFNGIFKILHFQNKPQNKKKKIIICIVECQTKRKKFQTKKNKDCW